MATKKKLLQAAAGTAAAGGAGALNVEDVFSTYLYDGNGGTKVIENGINLGQSFGSGGVELSSNYIDISSSISLSGDFTLEAWVWLDKSSYSVIIGNSSLSPNVQFGINSLQQVYITDPTELVSSGTINLREWTHVAVSRSGSTVYYFINGTASGTQTSSATLTYQQIGTVADVYNMWEGYISDLRIVSGTALYTSSFTAPTSPLTAVTGTQLLTCQGDSPLTDNSSNGYTLTAQDNAKASSFGPFDAADAGEGGLVWIKDRTDGFSNVLFDTERGFGNYLVSNTTFAQNGSGDLGWSAGSFNSNGFTTVQGTNGTINGSGTDFASWTFRKAPKFFTCLTYTGTGPASGANEQQVSHDLGVKPAVVIIKRTDSTGDWWFFTDVIDGSNDYGYLNQTAAFGNSSNNVPTDSVFNVGGTLNVSGATYVAYLFAHNDGDGEFGSTADQDIIKCGSYTGGGTSDVSVNLGFEPAFLIVKRTDSATNGNWYMFDSMRGWTQEDAQYLRPNTSGAEGSVKTDLVGQDSLELNSTGFKMKSQYNPVNQSGGTYIYIAIRRGPMAVPTAGTDVFDVNTYNATGVAGNPQTTGFPVDLAIIGQRQATDSWKHGVLTRLTGAVNYLVTSSTSGEQNAGGGINIDNMTGYDFQSGAFNTASPAGMYNLNWKRAPSFCDVVAYTGNGTAQTITHNLGVTPEFILLKNRSTVVQWTGYHKDLNGGTNPAHYKIVLNQTNGEGGSSHWNYTSPTSSDFTVGSSMSASSNNYIAYLFASLDGVSKVGSYTGSNSDQDIDCGFTSGARFVLIKRYSTTGSWYVFDTERGIVVGADGTLVLNDTSAESSEDKVYPYSGGFGVKGNLGQTNQAGSDYIFYAIA